MTTRYFYLAGDSGLILARHTAERRAYEYFDAKAKAWVPSAYVATCVVGYNGAWANEISETEALAFVKRWGIDDDEARSLLRKE